MEKDTDSLGRYDEAELIELSEADVYGGFTTSALCVATITLITATMCPTTACSSKC
ncbi:class II lanthipeptide, LchA2/BrtA2 family [Embleya hyalina]|uniref:Uncharacterized protein n=1 Tax=Embleya hyalina TaxID=516124 RepID=A0A401YR49_9ACTN|nr:class II lanthipeptide, LchA2/BrtA2 family [Embleya hyalina]GCD97071.1 hypothetical protein EHYA_04758 [Embleya hyalina]